MKITWLAVKVLLIGSVVYSTLSDVWSGYKTYGDYASTRAPLFGIYNMETFIRNGDTLPPLMTDSLQWKELNVPSTRFVMVKTMNDHSKIYNVIVDTSKRTVQLTWRGDSTYKWNLSFAYPDSTHLVLKGTIRNDSVYIVMRKIDLNNSLLVSRGFHWINEYPFNR
jgi:hypothetical protein